MGAALLDDDEESKGCQSPVREPEGYVRVHSPAEVEKREGVGRGPGLTSAATQRGVLWRGGASERLVLGNAA